MCFSASALSEGSTQNGKGLLTADRISRMTWIRVTLDSITSEMSCGGFKRGNNVKGWARCVSGSAVDMGNK